MGDKDTIYQKTDRLEDFVFDERVASVFDDMVARSVPFYKEIQQLQSELVMDFLPAQSGVLIDLGCSTGTTINLISNNPQCPGSVQFLGYDNSEPMLDKARLKLADGITRNRITLINADLSDLPNLPVCNVAIMNWTLQFVRPIDRQDLIRKIFQALMPGGAIFLSEKLITGNARLNRLYIKQYLTYKKSRSGYTDKENQRKREALENVLVPYSLEENHELLERSGFSQIETYFRWLNFACILAIKPD